MSDEESEADTAPVSASETDDVSEPEFGASDAASEDDIDPDEDLDQDDEPSNLNDAGADSEEAYDAEEAAVVRPTRGSRPKREIKKRQYTFYEEDDMFESGEEAPPVEKKRRPVKLKIPRRAATRKAPEDEFEEKEYTPDLLRMTERQRARLVEDEQPEKYEDSMFARMDEQLLALNRKAAKKKETAEQMALRKAENARKRAHYKTKQLEEEKRETLNKLLKRRATKTRETADEDVPEGKQTLKPRRPVVGHPALVRWVSKPETFALAADPAFF